MNTSQKNYTVFLFFSRTDYFPIGLLFLSLAQQTEDIRLYS